MELRHLRYFIAVAEALSFRRAAERLQLAQPALSKQIRQLEEEIGVPLFTRTTRRVRLTAAGRIFMEETLQTLTQVEESVRAAQRASRGETGRLAIGFIAPAAYSILAPILYVYRTRFPGIELRLREMFTVPQISALRERRLDVGLLRLPARDDELTITCLQSEAVVVALPESHPLASRPDLPLSALATEPFIIYPRQIVPGYYDRIARACEVAGFRPRVVQEAGQIQTILSLVAAGLGVALVPASLRKVPLYGVAYRSLVETDLTAELALAWRKDEVSPAVHSFVAIAHEVLEGPAAPECVTD